MSCRFCLEFKAVAGAVLSGISIKQRLDFTVFPAARNFGWISPRLVTLRKVAVITVSKLVTGALTRRFVRQN